MVRFLRNALQLVFFVVMAGTTSLAGQENSTELTTAFDFDVVSDPVSDLPCGTHSENIKMELIANNYRYVLITAGMFAFSLIIITLLMKITPHQAKDLVTIVGLVSVVFGTITLVLVVDTTEGLTAPMGILGAIAGYLFGAAQKNEKDEL